VTAGYQIALSGYHLREVQELKRLREERFLATLLEVERSHVPFPDEPPVEFPSAATVRKLTRGQFDNWADWSKDRITRYSIATFGSDVPGRLFELRNQLNKTVDFGGIDDPKTTLAEAIDQLEKRYRISIAVNDKAFKYEMLNDVLRTEIANPNVIPPKRTTLGRVIKSILDRIPVPSGATYVIRRDQIEITTGQFASAEKVVRVYPVADLVTPIPNAFNQQAVNQTASILGQLGQFGAGGLNLGVALGGGIQLGGIQLGGIQLGGIQLGGIQLGGIQLGGVQLGIQLGGVQLGVQLGGVQLGGVQLGVQLGQQLGGQVGQVQVGGFNFQGNVNLGAGGGFPGFTGGQLGQLGNLGGQFGLQGGDQSQLLITLIREVVGRPKDWAPQYNPITGQPLNPLDDQTTDGVGLNQDNNNLGYYPPALALVVKAPSTIHTRDSNLVITQAAAPGMAAADGDGRKVAVANDGDEKKDWRGWIKVKDGAQDPKEIWQNALAKGKQDPGLIIATTDYLSQNGKFDHTAEFLKANLRQGIVVKPWVFKSLAIALRESGGSADEIERAEVSVADVEPLDANGYLVAARALAEDKNYERAIAFCKQAATLAPAVAQPFADAARYAEMAGDDTTLAWAAGKLVSQDWPTRNDDVQQTAVQKVESLARRLDKDKAEKLKSAVSARKQRDLVVKMAWQGEADLDLKVLEPSGSVASSLSRQTIGGGTLIASGPGMGNAEVYAAAEAFSGEYTIHVEKVWGKPLGNKVQLKIIRYQGTKDETEQLITLRLTSNVSDPITVKMENGRRTETAYVAPPGAHEAMREELTSTIESTDAVLNKLRALADPEVTGLELGRPQGGLHTSGKAVSRPSGPAAPRSLEKDRTLYQTKVASFVQNSVDVTAQAVITADRRHVRLSLSTSFTSVKPGRVTVISPVFPGGIAPKR
jgi:tetratricopeptide (TPR) repeat protein